ncbi:hypothetical protein VU06_00720 [Desulfobulbus sp. F3]|nr:hypothetical protein [Desulfobulbus sp. F3]
MEEVVGLRNFLIHEYFGVDLEIHEYFGVDLDVVLEIIETDMPKLKDAVRNLLAALPE